MAGFRPSVDLEDLILVGKISKPHGIQGELKVFPYSGDSADFLLYKTVLLCQPERKGRHLSTEELDSSHEVEVTGVRPQAKFALVFLKGVDSRTLAEELVGLEVWTSKEYLPELETGEFFWHQVEGLTVLTTAGLQVGIVQGVLDAGGHDILVVKSKYGKEILIPAKDEFLKEINFEAGTIIISPPPGLLELNK